MNDTKGCVSVRRLCTYGVMIPSAYEFLNWSAEKFRVWAKLPESVAIVAENRSYYLVAKRAHMDSAGLEGFMVCEEGDKIYSSTLREFMDARGLSCPFCEEVQK